MIPFLSVITRHMPSRPSMLERNRRSLAEQSCQDFEHKIHVDRLQRGNFKAQQWLRDLIQEADGRYILVLDDDDYMVNPKGVEILKGLCETNPRGVIFRAEYRPDHILPKSFDWFPDKMWGMSQVGQLCYILRNDIFKRCSYVYKRGVDETDYLCLLEAWENAKLVGATGEFVASQEIINAAQRADSRGRPE